MNDTDVRDIVRAVQDMTHEIREMRKDVRNLTKAVYVLVDEQEVEVK